MDAQELDRDPWQEGQPTLQKIKLRKDQAYKHDITSVEFSPDPEN